MGKWKYDEQWLRSMWREEEIVFENSREKKQPCFSVKKILCFQFIFFKWIQFFLFFFGFSEIRLGQFLYKLDWTFQFWSLNFVKEVLPHTPTLIP